LWQTLFVTKSLGLKRDNRTHEQGIPARIEKRYKWEINMKALFIQHDHVSPIGPVGERLAMHGFEIETREVVSEANFKSPNVEFEFPDIRNYDLIIPLGAPWGAWDDQCIGKWLQPELDWIRNAVISGKPVLGICFGGQLIARALGGSVGRSPKAEIGWTYIQSDEPNLVGNGPWFQFHYDRWQLPDGVREIARNPVSSQAFVVNKTLGVQFHPELDANVLAGWLEWDGKEEVERDGQDPRIMFEQTVKEEPAARERTFHLVDSFLANVARLI
jgi:GMP synthase-like glutamine amidotransferase